MHAGLTIASIDAMRSRVAAIVVSCLLIERVLAIHVPVNGVAGVGSVEGLRIVVTQT